METTSTLSEATGYDRPLDTIISRLPSVFVPTNYVATLGQLSDIARAYGKSDDIDSINNKKYLLAHENNASSQQQLQWRFFYMDTGRLDQELNKMTHHQEQNSLERHHRSFLRTLESELIKVHDFYNLKLGEIQRRLDFCNRSNNDPSYLKKEPHKRLSHLESEMSTLPWDVQHLAHFVKANYCNLFAIVHKYDRHLFSPARHPHDQQQTVLQNQLFRLMASKTFCEPAQLFSLVVSLNELYKATRSNQLRLVDNSHDGIPAFSAVVNRNNPNDSDDDDDAKTHYYSTPASLNSWTPHVGGDNDELRQVPNYTSIYVKNTATANPTTRTTPPAPPRLTTTLLPSATLPPSPATTSDSEDYDDDETASLYSASEDTSDMLTVKQFWVHPDNVTEIMLYIAKYTDLSDSHLPPAQVDTASRRSQQSNQSTITTLHLDTPNLESYNNRVSSSDIQQREFTALRMRWYEEDQRDPAVTKPVVAMEEKVYRPYQTPAPSSTLRHKSFDKSPCRLQEDKDPFDEHEYQRQRQQHRRHDNKAYTRHRLWLKAKNMEPWLNGDWSFKHLLNKPYCHHRRTSLVHGSSDCTDSSIGEKIMQLENDARSRRIEPVLKTMLRRTVFSNHESELAISIDTEIAIARPTRDQKPVNPKEDNYRCYNSSSSECDDYFDHQPPPPKTRISSNENYPYPSFSSVDMVRFPYAVVKISYPSASRQRHAWLSNLCSSSLLEPVHDFSLYAHGIGVLMPDTVQTLPHWLPKMSQNLSRPENRGQLLKQQLRMSVAMEHNASSESNLLKLPPTPWSSTSAIYSPTSTKSSSSCISSNNQSSSTRATTPSSTKGKSVSEEDLRSAAVQAAAAVADASNEHQPLLPKKHQRPSVGSYCSFDHPSSSRSDPAQCRDCMARRQSSPSFYNRSTSNSNSRTSSSGSLFSQYNSMDKEPMTSGRIAYLIRTLWPTLGDLGDCKSVRPGAILPIHTAQHTSVPKNDTAKVECFNESFVIEDQKHPRALKLTIMCGMSAVALALIFYYALSTL